MTPAQFAGLTSSATPEWATPQAFFDRLNLTYGFELDVCATPENTKCARFFTEADDGLVQDWQGVVWMNPPYGRYIGKWVRKAYESARAGATVVCLLPARVDTAWWHDYCAKGDYSFVRGRLKFSTHKWHAPFPFAVVVFAPTVTS